MKFKVGDKVRYIKYAIYHNSTVKENSIWKIIEVDAYNRMYYTVDENYSKEWFKEEELEKIEYTYEDLKKSPIGTKITFENGEVLIKDDQYYFENSVRVREISDLVNLIDRYCDLGKIIKIEEPTYSTAYEYEPEILDEAEKRYLRGVIRPFRNKVEYIKKCKFITNKDNSYINICIKDSCSITLPYFESGKMYKNMENNKKYTLEELGL